MKRRIGLCLEILILFGLVILLVVSMDSKLVRAEGEAGFTYSIKFPENQMENDIGYYKLKLASGEEQTVQIMLNNLGSEDIKVNVSLNGAKTNQNGVIEYGDSPIKNDDSLKFDFTDIVTGPKTIELGPGETKSLDVSIKMPATSFDGVIAGGIQLMKAEKEKEEEVTEGGSKIINQYAYVIAMLLQQKEDVLNPDLKLNKVYGEQDNYRNAIFVNFSNVIGTYLHDMTVEAQISKKGSSTVLYERKQTAMRMAPNSFLNFPVSMNGESMVSGDYTANILVTSEEKKWEWIQDFKITKEEADKFNERDVGLVQEKGIDWLPILLIVGGIAGLGALVFFFLSLMRKKKEKRQKQLKKIKMKRLKNK